MLLLESVLEKYSFKELFTKLPTRIVKKVKYKVIQVIEAEVYYRELFIAQFRKTGKALPILLDTSAESDNVGDEIIMECCVDELPKKLKK